MNVLCFLAKTASAAEFDSTQRRSAPRRATADDANANCALDHDCFAFDGQADYVRLVAGASLTAARALNSTLRESLLLLFLFFVFQLLFCFKLDTTFFNRFV